MAKLNELDLQLFEILKDFIDNSKFYQGGEYVLTNRSDGYQKLTDPDLEMLLQSGDARYQLSEGEIIEKILGRYPTIKEVLRYISSTKSNILLSFNENSLTFTKTFISQPGMKSFYNLDLTKNIEDFTDNEKEGLIIFLQDIHK